MEKNEVLKQVENVFRLVFDDEQLEITMDTIADDVEEWDSLSHIQLVVSLEKQFKVKFTSREIIGLQNVGEMVDIIVSKL